MRWRRSRAGSLIAGSAAVLLALPGSAAAHVERPSYWPDPAPDKSVKPAAGGAVPKARPLASALIRKRPGTTRVVCHKNSLRLAARSIRRARKSGFAIRPSDRRKLSAKQAKRLLAINRRLARMCKFKEIQPAVTKSRNNDRVVVMPGLYMEPTARKRPTHDPKCKDLTQNSDRGGEPGALSYKYQFTCPNDQNLIAVLGRRPGAKPPPDPPLWSRHGIPDVGRCIRCNFQIEGSGVSADDVVIEAGDPKAGNGGPNGAGAKKDVGIRADRADGFVFRNITVRHAGEHGIYVIESDGYLLDRFKTFYNHLYGTLTFVEDHGIQQNCEAVGHGDSGIYPGAAVESGVQRPPGTTFRYNQQVRFCDLHHNLAGYSGTNGNAIHVHHNNIYGNALGIQTDVVTGAGHPGYPGDSALFELNQIYSNNFNPYDAGSDIKASFPFPTGTGLWIAGGNHHTVRANHFYDNWRRGTMLFSVPDSLVCGPDSGNKQAGCEPDKVSTSHYNQHFDNLMGVRPDGTADPNGTDFWWDDFSGSRGNCWYRNSGPKAITFSPGPLPDCDDGKDPAMSVGKGNPAQESELLACFVTFETRDFSGDSCPWLKTPPEPGAESGGGMTLGFTHAAYATDDSPYISPDPLGLLNCKDWNKAYGPRRASIIRGVTAFAGGPVTGEGVRAHGATLTAENAARLFDGWCGRDYAQDFLLYKLYTHAAAFVPRG